MGEGEADGFCLWNIGLWESFRWDMVHKEVSKWKTELFRLLSFFQLGDYVIVVNCNALDGKRWQRQKCAIDLHEYSEVE